MSTPVKEKITADLQKAKSEGSLRAERIRQIVREAVSQAVVEIKAGSVEIRTIAKDAMAAVADNLKAGNQEAEMTASIEGIVDGISDSSREQILEAQVQVDQLQAQIAENEQTIETNVESAIVGISEVTGETNSPTFQSLIASLLKNIKEQQLSRLQGQFFKLKEQLVKIDAKLADRYGDRYAGAKERVEAAKVRYDEAKARVAAGEPNPIDQAQAELTAKASEAGAAAARIEEAIKQRLMNLLQDVVNKR
ncbi:MAG TPA: hypothetical protein V6D10_00170 [Trichocoleus sp.]|jgi:hypothetical protein